MEFKVTGQLSVDTLTIENIKMVLESNKAERSRIEIHQHELGRQLRELAKADELLEGLLPQLGRNYWAMKLINDRFLELAEEANDRLEIAELEELDRLAAEKKENPQ